MRLHSLILAAVSIALLFFLQGCGPPNSGKVKSTLEEKSGCKISNFSVTQQGTVRKRQEYSWRGNVDCTRSRSFWNKKFGAPTSVTGKADFQRSKFIVTWEMVRYEMNE